ncbi:MAG: hypothetical protein IKU65_01110 [Oscillospiraceae bacterium]|nr:hypothetical protein [Oscillospiraceae bacterium]
MGEEKKVSPLFKFVKWLIWLFYIKMEVVGRENLPEGECVIVGNHTQMNGPIACELYFPENRYTWCAGQMMNIKEAPAYAYTDFWSQKPVYARPFYKLLSYVIAPIASFLFNNANTIPVYHDSRVFTTFRESVRKLERGAGIVIFPEYDKKFNNIIYDFQINFVDVARFYYKKSGKAIKFVPLYIAPKLKTMYLGKPVEFSPDAPIEDERRRIADYLMKEITHIARALPCHTVVPYRNIKKKEYPKNKAVEDEK